jgi:5'-nucleotidase
MRILITNDDGIHAEGILALKGALEKVGEVFVVAPDRPRSATGHAITLHKPLRLSPVRMLDGSTGYASNGTPTDCVTLGTHIVMEERVDLIVSGINAGPNLGWDLTYSGTVAGAIEGAVQGYPAFAISVAGEDEEYGYHYETAAEAASFIAQAVQHHTLPKHSFLNVNVPNVPLSQIKGYQATALGRRQYADRLEPRIDPWGRPYYWLSGSLVKEQDQPGTDVYAVAHGYISITPVELDFTSHALLKTVEKWFG